MVFGAVKALKLWFHSPAISLCNGEISFKGENYYLKKYFLYLFMRDTERKKGRNTGRRRIRLPAGSSMRDSIPGPWHHALSPRQTQPQSHPGVPTMLLLNIFEVLLFCRKFTNYCFVFISVVYPPKCTGLILPRCSCSIRSSILMAALSADSQEAYVTLGFVFIRGTLLP